MYKMDLVDSSTSFSYKYGNSSEIWHEARINSQGWFVGSNGKLLFWVPPYLRPCSLTTERVLVIPRPWIDVSYFIYGQEWHKIRWKGKLISIITSLKD